MSRFPLFLLAGVVFGANLYEPVEWTFRGPGQSASDSPARDISFWARVRHSSGSPEYQIHGFFDGDGQGGIEGGVFKIRFTPTKTGTWNLAEVYSSNAALNRQKQGETITVSESRHHGFWIPDNESAGRRWYRRSDGSHQYIVGNTQYSFLSGMREGGPSGVDIAVDIRNNATHFKKLRMGIHGDRYPHATEKPYLDDHGKPTDNGDFGHRPNPRWFHTRVDVAVKTAFEQDLVADLILCGPDFEDVRANLRAKGNRGDPAPFLRYVAARYGSFPNVWMCLCNEYDIRTPKWSPVEVAKIGASLRSFLPFPTPLSVHPASRPLWAPEFDGGNWFDHAIIQRKIRHVPLAADTIAHVHNNPGDKPRQLPVINDELSYEGEGDQHVAGDTIEAHLGAFLGGGYGTTGLKTGNKLGHYFWGGFTPQEHAAAPGLRFLREMIDQHIEFWRMAPDLSIFANLDADTRGMSWPRRQYVLGANRERHAMVAKLPEGSWRVDLFDLIARKHQRVSEAASGRFVFDGPASRAVLFVFTRK